MRKVRLTGLAFAVVASVSLGAQTPQTQPPPEPPARPAPPNPPYKPDFEIPKTDGSGRAQRPDPTLEGTVEGYVIGPQDNLSIIVADEVELTGKFRVDSDGTISMPYLGRVPLAGLSLADAQDKVTALLKKDYLKNPQVGSRSISSRPAACSSERGPHAGQGVARHDDVAAEALRQVDRLHRTPAAKCSPRARPGAPVCHPGSR
jgi:hypothetical protein